MKVVSIIGIYIVFGFLTFGHLHNTYVAPCGHTAGSWFLGLRQLAQVQEKLGGLV